MFRKLKASEIECRIGGVYQGGITLLLYKDARCDMAILDETVGAHGWQRNHKAINGTIYCGVALLCKTDKTNYDGTPITEWIWKWDAGSESNTEAEKGAASDSFKRACVNWGIGRELYTAPQIFIMCETVPDGSRYKLKNRSDGYGFTVKSIEYKDGAISYLEIEKKGITVFSWGTPEGEPHTISPNDWVNLVAIAGKHGETPDDVLERAGADSAAHITLEQFAKVVKAYEAGNV